MAHDSRGIGALWLPNLASGRILSWSDDKTLRLWDPATGLEDHTLRICTDDPLHVVKIEPDANGVILTLFGKQPCRYRIST